jgi:hypothetical protein
VHIEWESKTTLALANMVKRTYKLRRNKELVVTWPGQSPVNMAGDDFGRQALDQLAREVAGDRASPEHEANEAFSILTVVKGSGADPDPEKSPSEGLQKSLFIVTTWPTLAGVLKPPELSAVELPLRLQPKSHVLYAGQRGRALWAPQHFKASSGKITTLSDRHHWLALMTLQTEALAAFMAVTAEALDKPGGRLAPAHQDWADAVAEVLGRIYGPGQVTFRSSSPQRQIDDNGYGKYSYVEAINMVRQYFGRSPLAKA